jgi:hypothetical protein
MTFPHDVILGSVCSDQHSENNNAVIMEKNVEMIILEFNNVAARIYSGTLSQFSDSIRNINRNRDENVFKLQLGKYMYMLKNHLEEKVKKTLEANRSFKDSERLKLSLSSQVNYYLEEFRKRSNTL